MKQILIFIIVLVAGNLVSGQTESLKIEWLEKYEWKEVSNQEQDYVHVIEMIPGKENPENWTMLGQMLSLGNVLNVPMDEARNMMFEQTKSMAPYSELTLLEKDENDEYPWVLFIIDCPNIPGEQQTESQLWFVRQGKQALYVNFIAKKEKKLKAAFVAEWSTVFKASEIVYMDDKGK